MAQTALDLPEEESLANESGITIPSDPDGHTEVSLSILDSGKLSFLKRLFKRDGRRFNKYIKSSTVHGVVHIFDGKSKIRRFIWLLIMLSAGIWCMHNICDSIYKLTQGETTTTISILEPDSVDFPAVTLCNLNFIKRSFLDDANVPQEFIQLIQNALYDPDARVEQECPNHQKQTETMYNKSYPEFLWNGRHRIEEMLLNCRFVNKNCSANDFLPTFTPGGGVCYTFNSGKHAASVQINGTGTRYALTLVVYVMQHEYSVSHNRDAGIKIAIHPPNEPPQPDELGIAVPPGKNAFISVRETNVENRSSRRKCRNKNDITSFNFLPKDLPYSASSCKLDCLYTNIAQKCNCLGAGMSQANLTRSTSKFHNLHNCMSTVKDFCCQATQVSESSVICDCYKACKNTFYETVTSYSEFPAKYAREELANKVEQCGFNITTDNMNFLQENFIRVNIYFETLSVEEEITADAFGMVSLLSDVGGQLAFFLGASIVSVLEFLMWLFDEIKDRCCGIREKKIKHKLKKYLSKRKLRRAKCDTEESVVYEVEQERINAYTSFK